MARRHWLLRSVVAGSPACLSGRGGRPESLLSPIIRFGIAAIASIAILSACGAAPGTATPMPTLPPTRIVPSPSAAISPTTPPTPTEVAPTVPASATPAVTAAPALPATAISGTVAADRRTLPSRTPDMTTGARSDGWVLDAIEASESNGRTALTLRFEPLPGQTGGPQADAWFEASDTTYTIAVRGVRGTNLVLRPGEVTPLAVAPLRGYYALPVRDDTIFALVVAAARPSGAWTLTATDAPGVLRLTVESR